MNDTLIFKGLCTECQLSSPNYCSKGKDEISANLEAFGSQDFVFWTKCAAHIMLAMASICLSAIFDRMCDVASEC